MKLSLVSPATPSRYTHTLITVRVESNAQLIHPLSAPFLSPQVVRDDGLLLLAACPYHKLTILFSAINTYFSSSQTLAEEHYSWPLVEFPLRSLAPEDKFSWARSATQGSCINIVETCFCNYTEKGYAEVMYAPGRMIHLKRTCSKKEKRGYEAEWVSKEDLASGGHLALSVLFPGALTDHFPWYMIDAFSHVLKRK